LANILAYSNLLGPQGYFANYFQGKKMQNYKLFENYKQAILSFSDVNRREDFLIKELKDQRIYYAPFDYVNPKAKISIVGITPGKTQMGNMIFEAKRLLQAGLPDAEVIKKCKAVGSFSGSMRNNLVEMMDHVGIANFLKIETTAELFGDRQDLANLTSCIRYPTFQIKNGKEVDFNSTIKAGSDLFKFAAPFSIEEIEQAPQALILPLGPKVSAYFQKILKGTSFENRLLPELPHPSGANNERIAYFLGKKNKEDLSPKVNPEKLDAIKQEFRDVLTRLS